MAQDKILIDELDLLKQRFLELAHSTDFNEHIRDSIGTYKEKTLHLFLKNFIDPNVDHHEVRHGNFIADILNDDGITEIQTSGFYRVRDRIEYFLSTDRVTVVYPIAAKKYLVWIDPADGSLSERHISPKKALPIHILPELAGVGDLLASPGLTFRCIMMSVVEYRLQDGWGSGGKHGSHRYDIVPEELIDIVDIRNVSDIAELLPIGNDTEFTSTEFRKACNFPFKAARAVSVSLKFLQNCGVIEKVGKRKNAFLYKKMIQN